MVLNPADANPSTGIISVDARTKRGTMLVFKPMPEDSAVDTILLTREGWKTMRTKVANQNKADRAWSNMYLYPMEGMPA